MIKSESLSEANFSKQTSSISNNWSIPGTKVNFGLHSAWNYFKNFISKITALSFLFMIACSLYFGWQIRNEEFITPGSGIGYYLGIAGGGMIMLLFLYPARKNFRFMRNWGDTKFWFKLHMILGTIGPILILFHANFQMGSLNSSIVLVTTLLVSVSGYIGRYIYTQIHYGLYGNYINLDKIKEKLDSGRSNLDKILSYSPVLMKRLQEYENIVTIPGSGFSISMIRICYLSVWTSWSYFIIINVLRRAINTLAKREGWSGKEQIIRFREAQKIIYNHIRLVLKIADFRFFERLMSLWHILHLPLFIFLIIFFLIHVIVVHMY